jgi:hypothetical protein
LLEDLNRQLDRLNSMVSGKLTDDTTSIIGRMGEIHAELDKLRRQAKGLIWPGRRGKIADRIQNLDGELMDLHDRLRFAIANPAADANSPMMMRVQASINNVLDQIESAEQWSAVTKDPVANANYYVKRAEDMFKAFKGDSNVPLSEGFAGAMSAARNVTSAGLLSMASISAITDQNISMAARALNGMPIMPQITSWLKAFTPADRQLALEGSISLDQVRAAWQQKARYLSGMDARGLTGLLADRTHALSLLSPMTQAAKVGYSLDFMRYTANLQKHQWNRLPKLAKRMLERHGYTADEWDALRQVQPSYKQASRMLMRSDIEQALGVDAAEKYMTMLLRERGGGVLESTLRGRTLWVSDAQPGTIQGEALRSIAMLKSFPTSFAFLVLNRMYREMVMNGLDRGTVGHAAFVMLGGIVFGALAIQLKNIAHGRDPENMATPEFIGKAFLQAGGAGIYGDFINSAANRHGNGIGDTMLGPLPGFLNAPLSMTVGSAIRYARDEKTNPGREAVQFARRYTPIVPFYTRLAYNRLVLDEIQKVVDPEAHKSFRQQQQSLRRRTKQEFFYPPGGQMRNPNLGAAFGN